MEAECRVKPPTVALVEDHIKGWSKARKSNISLRTFVCEIDTLCDATGVEHFKRVLEVRCGSGIFLISYVALGLAETGFGIDPTIAEQGTAPSKMAEGRALAKRLGVDVTLENQSLVFDFHGDGAEQTGGVVMPGEGGINERRFLEGSRSLSAPAQPAPAWRRSLDVVD